MATTITGPGIAVSSEIAAVSVGVYADTQPFQAGMAQVRQTTQQTAVAVEQKMISAGATVQSSLVGGAVEGAKGFRKAIKALEKTALTGLIGVGFVTGAFQLGQNIGSALAGGYDKKGKLIEERLGRLADIYGKVRAAEFEAAAAATKVPRVELEAASQRIADADKKLEAKRKDLADVNKFVAKTQQLMRDFPSTEAEGVLARDLEWQKRLIKEIADIEKRRASDLDLIEGKLKRTTELEKQSLQIKREQEDSERRAAALRDVAADKFSTSISQLARLLDYGLRQKYPPQQGGGMER
jgi:hypothetical protein